jgi:hypothetical protein
VAVLFYLYGVYQNIYEGFTGGLISFIIHAYRWFSGYGRKKAGGINYLLHQIKRRINKKISTKRE